MAEYFMDDQNEFRRLAFAIDCEMVDVVDSNVTGSQKARKFPIKVVIVNEDLKVVYDAYVKPNSEADVKCDNKFIHGISLKDVMNNGISFDRARRDVHQILKGNLAVGHDLDHDLKALGLTIPSMLIRDTACARMFVNTQPPPSTGWTKPSLAQLAKKHLYKDIQNGFHEPIEDAKTAMQLYILYRHPQYHQGWERPAKTKSR